MSAYVGSSKNLKDLKDPTGFAGRGFLIAKEVGMVRRVLSGRGLSRATLCALRLVLLPTSATFLTSPDEAWLPSASAEFRAGGQRKRALTCVVLGLRTGMRGGNGDIGGSMSGVGLQGWERSLDGRLLAAVRERIY